MCLTYRIPVCSLASEITHLSKPTPRLPGTCRLVTDWGSGSVKFEIALIDPDQSHIVKRLAAGTLRTRVMDLLLKSRGTAFPPAAIAQMADAAREIQRICQPYGAFEHEGIATAAYREASNSDDAMQAINEILGGQISVVSQIEEAKLAHQAAAILTGEDPAKLITWDTGAGSFQIIYSTEADVQCLLGPIGSSVVNQLLKAGAPGIADSLPQIIGHIRRLLPEAPDDLSRAIGEGQQVTLLESYRLFGGPTPEPNRFTIHQLRTRVEQIMVMSRSELHAQYPEAIRPTALPRLMLRLAIMDHYTIERVTMVRTTGSTSALLSRSTFF